MFMNFAKLSKPRTRLRVSLIQRVSGREQHLTYPSSLVSASWFSFCSTSVIVTSLPWSELSRRFVDETFFVFRTFFSVDVYICTSTSAMVHALTTLTLTRSGDALVARRDASRRLPPPHPHLTPHWTRIAGEISSCKQTARSQQLF